MGRYCLVCQSPHVDEYNKLRLAGKPIKEIWAYSVNQYNEVLKYWNFAKHFQHVEEVVESSIKEDKLRQTVIRENVKKDIAIVRRMTANLEMLNDKIQEKKDLVSVDDERLLLGYLAESRMVIEQLIKWGSKLELSVDDNEIYNRILKCMEDFPADLVEKFIIRWKEQLGSSGESS